jgi:hypothetical protein
MKIRGGVRVAIAAMILGAAAASGAENEQALKVVPKSTPVTMKKKFEPKPPESLPFFVFNNAVFPPVKNFALSGYMGDVSDIKISGSYSNLHVEGYPTLKVVYGGEGLMGWGGVVWQNPANNWGEFDGGYNLTKAKRLTFWARGDKGGEIVEFKIGGTAANYPDSDNLSSGDITLSDRWQKYALDLSKADLAYISAGFGFVLKQDMNPDGCTFYIDDVRYDE